MEGGSIKDLAKYRFEKAVSNITVAKTLYSSGDYSVALNRAYYSAFDAIRPVSSAISLRSAKIVKCSIKILEARATDSSGVIEPFVQTSSINLS